MRGGLFVPIRKVHVVYKTHLDIGFTDLADHVVDHYVKQYIPAAIRMAESLNQPGKPPLFIWTVGSYLIDHALRVLAGRAREDLLEALRKGYITYHALPYTLHSELCDRALFEAGLGITKRLDRLLGKHTIAAKMTDVPGHSLGIVGPLAAHGVRFLHIGINDVARMAKLPPLFYWENSGGQRVLVNYTRSYGGLTQLEGHDEVLYFQHSSDNMSPPGAEQMTAAFARLQERFPLAEVCASTLDAFALGLVKTAPSLPVIRGEIGDTWIHGVGSDPKKTAQLRALSRLSRSWDGDGAWASHPERLQDGRNCREAFLENLLLVCEHSWGLDTKKFLTDYRHWNRQDFEKARAHNRLEDSACLLPGYESMFRFAKEEFEKLRPEGLSWEDRSFALFESSHQEQRQYVERALACLPEPLQTQARTVWEDPAAEMLRTMRTELPDTDAAPAAQAPQAQHVYLSPDPEGGLLLSFGDQSLSIGLPLYQETGRAAFDQLIGGYLDNIEANRDWALPDNGKPGLECSDASQENRQHLPGMTDPAFDDDKVLRWEGHFDEAPHCLAGCPERYEMALQILGPGEVLLSLRLMNKPANRKPEALFLPFAMPGLQKLFLRKIGAWIDPETCVPGGNQRVHALEALALRNEKGWIEIRPLDSPLVSLGKPELLSFDRPEPLGKVYTSLYNNLWGTNFKMWYEEDLLCRFLIRMQKEDPRV